MVLVLWLNSLKRLKYIQEVIPVLKQMGMKPATLEDYNSWLIEEKEKLRMQLQEMRAL